MDEQQAGYVAEFIQRCIALDPDDRPSAQDLLQDEWFEGADGGGVLPLSSSKS